MIEQPDQAPTSHDTRIYLAGHRGLVGGAVLRALSARGYEHVLVRTHEELDLTDQGQVSAFLSREQPELVILAAAHVGGILANWERPYEFVRDNLAIELNVIHEAFRAGVKRLVFLGSSCIYPKFAPQPLKEDYLLTGSLEETNRPYAVAKIAGIELCRSLNREYGTEYLSLMPTNLYGPGDNFDLMTSHLLPALIRKFHEADASAGRPVTLWGTGTPRRELLYVDDLADAMLFLLELADRSAIPNGLLNVGTGNDTTIAELAELVAGIVGYKGPVQWDTSKPDGTPQKLLDISRLSEMGWRPSTELPIGIRETYEWFLENRA
jgi:GDP-L-fucose synthase